MLDSKSAKELEQRVLERFASSEKENALIPEFRSIAIQAAIVTIQEYERMQEQADN